MSQQQQHTINPTTPSTRRQSHVIPKGSRRSIFARNMTMSDAALAAAAASAAAAAAASTSFTGEGKGESEKKDFESKYNNNNNRGKGGLLTSPRSSKTSNASATQQQWGSSSNSNIISSPYSSSSQQHAQHVQHHKQQVQKPPKNALTCTICYRGMDVIFASTSQNTVLAICARTRVPFQYLEVSSDEDECTTIISLVGNSTSGLILVTLSTGEIFAYFPHEAPVSTGAVSREGGRGKRFFSTRNKARNHHQYKVEEEADSISGFGRFRWYTSRVINCAKTFIADHDDDDDDDDEGEGTKKIQFCQRRKQKGAGSHYLDVSCCRRNIVLVAYRDQMAVFDVQDPMKNIHNNNNFMMNSQQNNNNNNSKKQHHYIGIIPEAELLWITQLDSLILQAKLSGDGVVIALVTYKDREGVPGVKTFIRDKEDGSFVVNNNTMTTTTIKTTRKRQKSLDGHSISIIQQLGTSPSEERIDLIVSSTPNSPQNNNVKKHPAPPSSIGIVYKPGPYLIHSKPVTRISWRGGSSNDDNILHDGNDLLLTHCAKDSSMRIFSQSGASKGSMKQLMQWSAPPGSRADWIHGISSANFGDLDNSNSNSKSKGGDTNKHNKDGSKSNTSGGEEDGLWNLDIDGSRSASSVLNLSGAYHGYHGGGLDSSGRGDKGSRSGIGSSDLLHHNHPRPSCGAGAWIAELTFRGTYPALRLSRLSYMKSGGEDFHPAHFESVAAMLPAGALAASAVSLHSEDDDEEDNDDECDDECEMSSFSVHGFWPVWNPWNTGSSSGSSSASSLGNFVMNGLGGSHAPPSELRIVSSHSETDRAVILEFPLWRDKEYGSMEFGAPLKYLLVLSTPHLQQREKERERYSNNNENNNDDENGTETEAQNSVVKNDSNSSTACLEFESSCLIANIAPDKKSVNLTWHREGSMSVLPNSVFSSSSNTTSKVQKYIDVGVSPLPLSLPSIRNPKSTASTSRNTSTNTKQQGDIIRHVRWWPDENFGGPPRILFLNNNGTLVVCEMPPPWSALEPPMPDYHYFGGGDADSMNSGTSVNPSIDRQSSFAGETNSTANYPATLYVEGESIDYRSKEYDVQIKPHPDFGIGLRLESQSSSSSLSHFMPAIAGSFKKHPLTGGRLPAERTGMILLGDELLAMNDVSLENMSFDEIISTVRRLGSESKKNNEDLLWMRFRRVKRTTTIHDDHSSVHSSSSLVESTPGRKIFNLSSMEKVDEDFNNNDNDLESGGCATMMVGAEGEIQQEFCRIVALVHNALPPQPPSTTSSNIVLLPWNYGVGAPDHVNTHTRGVALIITSEGKTLTASRLEVTPNNYNSLLGSNPENSKHYIMGKTDLEPLNDDDGSKDRANIHSITVVKTATVGWCLAVCDEDGNVSLMFIYVSEEQEKKKKNESTSSSSSTTTTTTYVASFRQCHIFKCQDSLPKFISSSNQQTQNNNSPRKNYLVRAYSVQLLATLPRQELSSTVTVWLALPRSHVIKQLEKEKENKEKNNRNLSPPDYRSITVSIDPNDTILDFRWLSSGKLDSFPWLVTFSRRSAIVHRRPAGKLEWNAVIELKYQHLSGSHPNVHRSSSTSYQSSSTSSTNSTSASYYRGNLSPADVYPHIIPTLRSMMSSNDEQTYLRSDWHPDAILAHICTEDKGADVALQRNTKGLYSWLSQWMSPDASARPQWNSSQLTLEIAPFRNVVVPTQEDISNSEDSSQAQPHQLSSTLASMTLQEETSTAMSSHLLPSESEMLMDELQASLLSRHKYLETQLEKNKKKENNGIGSLLGRHNIKKSREFIVAMSLVEKEPANDTNRIVEVPAPLKRLNADEILFLWAMGNIVSKPPNFKNLDSKAKLTVFAFSLLTTLESLREGDGGDENNNNNHAFYNPSRNSTPVKGSQGSSTVSSSPSTPATAAVFRKRESFVASADTELSLPPGISSAACLSALLSNTQKELLDNCRTTRSGGKLDWITARALQLPFWLRDNKMLFDVTEEIAQQIFKTQVDVMECALFYVAMRKMPKLQNLARADGKESGRKLHKFITSFDFSSPRGRKAAEKNAYSLLRKRQYGIAAAFFLLAEPPMLQTALSVIVTQMEDINLAFLVARLIEESCSKQNDFSIGGGGASSLSLRGLSLGGALGTSSFGGGSGSGVEKGVSFEDWKPKLGPAATKLLEDHGLEEAARNDACMKATHLLWLNKPLEAARCMSAGSTSSSSTNNSNLASSGVGQDQYYNVDVIMPTAFDSEAPTIETTTTRLHNNGNNNNTITKSFSKLNIATGAINTTTHNNNIVPSFERVIVKSNLLITFCAAPFLLKAMNAHHRIRWSSTLHVARAFKRRGLELPSVQVILNNTDSSDIEQQEEKEEKGTGEYMKVTNNSQTTTTTQEQSSSIFDSFDTAPPTAPSRPKSQPQPSGGMSSSIFDSFDTAPPTAPSRPKSQPQPSGTMSSSIFDSFDTAPPKPKPQPQPSGGMSSSIFDSFDTAPPKPKPQPSAPSGTMSSSIFDSFDTAPPKPKPQPSAPSGTMTSSIFDSFDTAPPKPKPQPSAPSGTMTSSIFDSFDTAPTRPKPKQTTTTSPSPTNVTVGNTNSSEVCIKEEPEETPLPVPFHWLEWREYLLAQSVARRLLREVAQVVSKFYGDSIAPPIRLFRRQNYPLVPASTAEVLQTHCEGSELLLSLQQCLDDLCSTCHLEVDAVIEQALMLLGCPGVPQRIVFAVLLYRLVDREDLAEDIIRDASQSLMRKCESFGFGNDDLVYKRNTVFHVSSQYSRRKAAKISWQLELCLWLHRGGVFVNMSGIAIKETTIAVRVGFLLASWGKCSETLETLIKCDPDCAMNYEDGRQLWTSMKTMENVDPEKEGDNGKNNSRGSGGWEFLVDCKRDEATELLRDRKVGSFLLRPHPDDHGVFTLSFKTNLVPTVKVKSKKGEKLSKSKSNNNQSSRPVAPDDVVQHAIIRLSDSGFRCGSFGPFPSLIKLLEEVSTSLPFRLLFDEPPAQGIIRDEGCQASPNAILFRKLALQSKTENYKMIKEYLHDEEGEDGFLNRDPHASFGMEDTYITDIEEEEIKPQGKKAEAEFELRKRFGMISQLLVLSELVKQMSAIASAEFEESPSIAAPSQWKNCDEDQEDEDDVDDDANNAFSSSNNNSDSGMYSFTEEEMYEVSSRFIRPLLQWCHAAQTLIVPELAPCLADVIQSSASLPVDVAVTETAIEAAPSDTGSSLHGGDAVIRGMIQQNSGVEFRTLRVGEGGNSVMIVLFSRVQALSWLVKSGAEKNEAEASSRLRRMQERRVIEEIDLSELAPSNQGKPFSALGGGGSSSSNNIVGEEKRRDDMIRYRIVDPWEVEVLETKDGEVRGAALGRERLLAFNFSTVARSCEGTQRDLGGARLLSLWSTVKGGIYLTKAIASIHPPWDRDTGADLQVSNGVIVEPSPFLASLRKGLYRNALFRRLRVPQRFITLLQVELLDLKNLTSSSGSSPLTAYALLRLKRSGSLGLGAPLNLKARTLDSAITKPKKILKSSGPNPPASWGSLVRFRFVLPEDVNCDGVSLDMDREALFRGAPSVLQLAVYEKKFMSDLYLGGADVKLDALSSGSQLEEWVPLMKSSNKDGITWFARVRITLRFELMCLDTKEEEEEEEDKGGEKVSTTNNATTTATEGKNQNSRYYNTNEKGVETSLVDQCPSVGLRKMKQLSKEGGIYEDSKGGGMKASVSTPDFLTYLENMTAF